MAAAEVKPVVTGIDINLTKTPRFKMPKTSIIQPDKKQSNTALSGLPDTWACTIKAIIAVGPLSNESILIPNKNHLKARTYPR